MRGLVLLFVFILVSTQLRAASVQEGSGSLVYSDGVDGNFNSLVYKTNSGGILRVFDEGLSFNYDSRYDAGNLSPDKAYSVVQFSESGVGAQQEPEKIYLCAFVRMSDGCVVNVESGEQCGGEWSGARRWSSSISSVVDYSFKEAPTVEKIYKDYESGRKDLTQVSSPRVLAYFLEGTTFDNLLACDPPRDTNKKTYTDMLALLQRDNDTKNLERLRVAMSSDGVFLSEKTVSDWIVKSVLSEKAYLYSSPSLSDISTAYLIRGDIIYVLPNSNNPFVKFRYQQKGGKLIEKWVRCEDVDFCGRR